MKKATLILLGLFFVLVPANAQQKADPPAVKPETTATAPAVNKDTVIQIQKLQLAQAGIVIKVNALQAQYTQLQTQAQQIAQQIQALKLGADAARPGYELDLDSLTYHQTQKPASVPQKKP